MRVPHPFRVLCERVGTLLWSRSDSAFAYLSFRIRFSGESLPCFAEGGCPILSRFLRKVGTFCGVKGNLLSHTCHSEERSNEESAVVRHSENRPGAHPLRVLCERVGTFSRSRTESAFTHLSFRGAQRRGICSCSSFEARSGAPSFRAFCERVGTFL
jgi:hypothetical protein